MNLTSEISLDQIDAWFSVGKAATATHLPSIPAGKFLGKPLDPETKKPFVPKEPDHDYFIPAYKRSGSAEEYQEVYDEYIRQGKQNIEPDVPGASLPPDNLVSQMEELELDSTVCGGVGMPEDFDREDATEVYNQYSFQHQYDPKLPITRFAEEVLLTIESNQVTIVQGSTGSGKTTQVPQYILDHYAERGEYCNIIVTQPRRIAAMSIAKRVCQERCWPLGSVCGYQIGMDMKSSEDTRLLYCTTGVLREKLMSKRNMHQFTHVILDEVHERDQESDFALLIVKKLLRTNSRHVKVVLMSATMNCEEFASYFSLPVLNKLEPAPVVSVEGQVFRISEFYADDLSALGQLPFADENKPELHPDIVDISVRLIEEFDTLEAKEQGVDKGTGFATIRGTVLMFLPGLMEITFVLDKLRAIESSCNLTVIPLHSTITIDEQARVFEKPARGFRKVILSTNIAESSITVPDIKYVIDFCLTKCLVCDHDTNYTHLQLEWASKSNCRQRKGRAGRVSQGRVYFMVTQKFFEHSLYEHSLPEMQRCPLETLVLKSKLLDMGEPIAILSQAMSPPHLENIERTILSLKQVGALCLTSRGTVKRFDGDLTFVGRVLAEMPVDIRIGKLMILGYVFGLLEECIIIGAALSLKSIFATPFQSRFQAFMHKYQWSSGSLSDCQGILHAYKVWQKCKELQEFKRTGLTENQWGVKNFIQTRRMNEVHELVRELTMRLERFNLVRVRTRSDAAAHRVHMEEPGELSPKDSLFLKIVICGAFYPNYFCKKESDEMEALKTLSNHDPVNTVMVRGLPQNQGVLYRDRLEELFVSCCPRDLTPTVDVEESRAYITFPRSGKDQTSQFKRGVNPSVCFALKLRQLRIPLKLEAYSREASQGLIQLMQDAHEQATSQGFLRTNRVRGTNPDVDKGSGAGMKVALPAPTQTVVEVFVTEVVQCGNFYIQCLDQNHTFHLRNLVLMLNPVSKLQKLTVRPHKDMMCAAPYVDEMEAYYRARIEKLETRTLLLRGIPTSVRVAEVFFVDYGNREDVPLDKLRALPQDAFNIPLQALECELTEIRPSSVKCPDGNWTKEANAVFHNMVYGQKFLAQIYAVVNDVVRLELVLPTPQGGEISINERLIQMRLADKAEESYFSKQDHDWRLAEATGANGLQDGNIGTAPHHQRSLYLDVRGPPSGFRRKGKTINLMGPTNPLEMEFTGLTFTGSFKAVRVDPESVNSAVVDTEPQNRFSRMMVSAFLSLNPEGSVIIARDTTIMPQIPGMLAIMCLIFSPVVELRVDSKRHHYTGALCGLGSTPGEHSHPLLPDHDIEVAFDVDIDDEDIHLINRVRHAINLALGSKTNTAEWGPDAVAAKIQTPARERLLELLYKTREYKEPEYSSKDYVWSLLNPQEIVTHEDDFDSDFLTLLPPHATVRLVAQNVKAMDHQRNHIDNLHRIASTHTRGPITCNLCKVTVQTSQLLAIHLETERHLRREQKVLDHYSNK